MIVSNIFCVFWFAVTDQGFWDSIFQDYGLKGKWSLVYISLTNQYGYSLNWLNDSFIVVVLFSLFNIYWAGRIFVQTKKLSQEVGSQNKPSS
jgi:hypothetical protein